MIDINELRRLARAASPGPWIAAGPSFGESLPKYLNEVVIDRAGDEDDGYSICGAPLGLDKEGSDDMAFVAAANPATITELLDRLESAESDCLEQARMNGMGASREAALMAKLEAAEKDIAMKERIIDSLGSELNAVAKERDALRAKVEAMEQQKPVAFALYSGWARKAVYLSEIEACEQRDRRQLTADLGGSLEAYRVVPLYLAPGAKGE